MMQYLHYPTPEQIRAIEQAARRARAEAIARMFRTIKRELNASIAHGLTTLGRHMHRGNAGPVSAPRNANLNRS